MLSQTMIKRFIQSEEWQAIEEQLNIYISNTLQNLEICDLESILLFRGKLIAYRELLGLPETLIQISEDDDAEAQRKQINS